MGQVNKVLQKHYQKYDKAINNIVQKTEKDIIKFLQKNLIVENGIVVKNAHNLRIVNNIDQSFFKKIKRNGLNDFIKKFKKNFTNIFKQVNEEQKDYFVFSQQQLGQLIELKKYQADSLIDNIKGNITLFQKNIMEQVMIGGFIIAGLLQRTKNRIQIINSRMDATAIDATRNVIHTATNMSLEVKGIPENQQFFEYVGPLDDKTRQICQDALNKQVYTAQQRMKFEHQTMPRYNCRHHFQYISEKVYKRIKGDEK